MPRYNLVIEDKDLWKRILAFKAKHHTTRKGVIVRALKLLFYVEDEEAKDHRLAFVDSEGRVRRVTLI